MSELKLFYLQYCPHCKKAMTYLDELCAENPAYAQIPIQKVEESKEAEMAEKYDYYYVPCFFNGEEKLAEGVLCKEDVKAVLDKAIG